MTRNAHIDIDIEGEGIGIWVEPGDEEAWRRSLRYLQQNRDTAAAMGRRARALLQERYHIDRFAAQLTAHLERVHARV
jgi:glycosyltransferase involved in cell wall biosynthesis